MPSRAPRSSWGVSFPSRGRSSGSGSIGNRSSMTNTRLRVVNVRGCGAISRARAPIRPRAPGRFGGTVPESPREGDPQSLHRHLDLGRGRLRRASSPRARRFGREGGGAAGVPESHVASGGPHGVARRSGPLPVLADATEGCDPCRDCVGSGGRRNSLRGPSLRPSSGAPSRLAAAVRAAVERRFPFRSASARGSPFRPGAVVVPDIRVAEEVLQDEPRVGRPFAVRPAGFGDLARIHKYHEINAYHASNGFEGPRVYDPAGPQRDAAQAEGLQGGRRQL